MASGPPDHDGPSHTRARSGTATSTGIGPGPAGGGIIDDLVRRASIVMNSNPQLGMWQAAGTAIAQAPNLAELRGTETGGADFIEFNSQGHSARIVAEEDDGELVLVRSNTRRGSLGGAGGQEPRPQGMERRATGTVLHDVYEEGGDQHGDATSPSRRASASGPSDLPPDNSHGSDDKHKRHRHRFGGLKRRQTLKEKHKHEKLAKWGPTIKNGLVAFWKFFTTLAGFFITIYCLNIVAWGAMLFFLLLNAAPAMAVPTADDDYSPRKIWLEIDSQILNALFCVTGLGLAPWRFRDLYFFVRATQFRDVDAMQRLARQNKGWFRPPLWATPEGGAAAVGGAGGGVGTSADSSNATTATKYSNVLDADHDRDIELGGQDRHSADQHSSHQHHHYDNDHEHDHDHEHEPRRFVRSTTFTGQRAPPTALWKLFFTIMMMVANTGFQCALCYFMWGFNRFDRPTWATGTFIGLGCGTGMFSGLMSWWEGRKVKKIEGPEVQIVEKEQQV